MPAHPQQPMLNRGEPAPAGDPHPCFGYIGRNGALLEAEIPQSSLPFLPLCPAVQRMLDELARCAPRQFDPRIASITIEWYQTNPGVLILPSESSAVFT